MSLAARCVVLRCTNSFACRHNCDCVADAEYVGAVTPGRVGRAAATEGAGEGDGFGEGDGLGGGAAIGEGEGASEVALLDAREGMPAA